MLDMLWEVIRNTTLTPLCTSNTYKIRAAYKRADGVKTYGCRKNPTHGSRSKRISENYAFRGNPQVVHRNVTVVLGDGGCGFSVQ